MPVVRDVVAALERGQGPLEPVRLVGEQREQRLALAHLVAGPRVPDDAGTGLHRVLLARPTGAEPPGGQPDRHRVEAGEHAGRRGRRRRASPWPRAGRRPGRRPGPGSSPSRRPSPTRRRACRRGRRRRVRRRRASPGPGPGSARPRRPAHRRPAPRPTPRPRSRCRRCCPSGVPMSVSSATVRTPASVPSATIISASSRALVDVLHERAAADLDVEHQRAGALGDLLAHDRRGDQRDRLDGAGHVAQRVELLVRRRQPVAGRADHRADVLELGEHLLVGEVGAPARGSTPACRGCRRCARARARTAAAPRRRRRRPAGPAAA